MSRTAFKNPKGNEGVGFQIQPFQGANLVAFQISPRFDFVNWAENSAVRIYKLTLTKNQHTAILCPPQHEVGFSGSFFRTGDNTPIIKSVFLCLPFLGQSNFGQFKSIMTALFGQPLWLVVPVHDTANPLNAVTRFLAVLRDGFIHFRLGITAWIYQQDKHVQQSPQTLATDFQTQTQTFTD